MKKTTILLMTVLLTALLIPYSLKGKPISKSKLGQLEDSLNRVLDTIPKDERYFNTLSTLEMTFLNSPRLLHYAEKKEEEARKLNMTNFVCESYSDRAIYYSNVGNVDSFYYFKKLMDPLALELKEFNYYFFLGNIEVALLIKNGKIERAIQTAKNLYETARKLNSDEGLIAANMSIGRAMMGAKRNEEAINSFEKSLSLMNEKKISRNNWYLNNYSYLILLCDELKRYAQGLEYAYQKEQLIEKIKNANIGQQQGNTYMLNEWCDVLIKKVYFNSKLGNFEKAQKQLEKIYEYYPDLTEKMQKQYHHASSEFYQAKGDNHKALAELDSCYDYYFGSNPNTNIQLMGERANLLTKNGADKEAVKLYQDLIVLKDSINNKWMDAQVGELRAIYDTDHLKLVNSELELKNKHNQVQTILITLILSILTLVGISLLCVRIFRIKKKLENSEEQLKQEKEALKIAKEKAEEARDLAQKAERKESFFANMSHEIRTPLNAIVGFSNLLATEEDVSDEERVLFIKMINQNSEQLLKLINDVLDLSRMESDKMLFAFEDQDMTELIEETYSTSQMIIPKHLAFTKSYPDTSVRVHIDKMRTKQVLFNFINNAVKFTETGIIHIGYKVDKEEKTVSIFVKDTGRGIPVEHQKKIFERFYKQVDTDQGTGLGLSICTIIAEKLGGRITLVSEVGKGSCFSIVLPYDETIN